MHPFGAYETLKIKPARRFRCYVHFLEIRLAQFIFDAAPGANRPVSRASSKQTNFRYRFARSREEKKERERGGDTRGIALRKSPDPKFFSVSITPHRRDAPRLIEIFPCCVAERSGTENPARRGTDSARERRKISPDIFVSRKFTSRWSAILPRQHPRGKERPGATSMG